MTRDKMGLRPDEIMVGAVVRLTGRFLRTTGQEASSEGAKRWTIVACDCGICVQNAWRDANDKAVDFRLVAVNEPHEAQTPEGAKFYADLAPADRPKWRHINAANLEIDGKLVRLSNSPDADPPLRRPLDRRSR